MNMGIIFTFLSSFFARSSLIDDTVARQAAVWWAQYLSYVRDVKFSGICNFKEDTIEMVHKAQKKYCVPKKLVDNFIDILQGKILLLEAQYHRKYIMIEIDYNPPKIIEEAIDEAGIRVSPFGLFPFKTNMVIHQDGYIIVNNKVVYLNENLKLLSANDPILAESIKVKINLPQFIILKINLTTLEGDLYEYGTYPIQSQEYR